VSESKQDTAEGTGSSSKQPDGQEKTAAPPPGDDPFKSAIDELEKEAGEARVTKDTSDLTFADKENRLTALRTARRDLDANQKSYREAYEKLKREEDTYAQYRDSEEDSLKKLLKDKAAEVQRKGEALRQRRDDLEAAVPAAEEELRKAEQEPPKSQAAVKKATDIVNQYKKLAAAVTARHGRLKALRDDITKSEQAGQYAVAYWLLHFAYANELDGNDVAKPIEPDTLPQELLDALQALATVESTYARDQQNVANRRRELADAKKNRDDHVANAEKELRAELEQVQPAEAATRGAAHA